MRRTKVNYYFGIDVGSTTTKVVVVDAGGCVLSSSIVRTGAVVKEAVTKACEKVFIDAGVCVQEAAYVVSTGYGRRGVSFAQKCITEITAHAKGIAGLFPGVYVVIDIGGQDTKVIVLDDNAQVDNFVMNDKCAAGTGRFLEVMAGILNLSIDELGEVALKYTKELAINSTCTVFAESEVISLISREESIENIAYAVHSSVIDRIISLVKKVHSHGDVALTGGVSKNKAIFSIIGERLGVSVNLPQNPQIVGALGAALLAREYSK